MRIALSLVLLAACADDGAPQPPCGDVTCAGSEVCDRGSATPMCLPASADADGDGIANAMDLCPRIAGDAQTDEDGDKIGDICDRCPIAPFSIDREPDTDGDDVDDVCDPEPELPGNRIVLFQGFRFPLTGGIDVPAGWTVQGGELIAAVPGVSPEPLLFPMTGTNHFAIEASFRVDSIVTAGGATPSIQAVARDVRPAGTTLMQCGVAKLGTTERVQISTDVDSSNAVGMNLFDSAALYRLGFLVDGGQTACAVVANAETMFSTATRGGGEQMTQAGLDVGNATARFQWIMITAR